MSRCRWIPRIGEISQMVEAMVARKRAALKLDPATGKLSGSMCELPPIPTKSPDDE